MKHAKLIKALQYRFREAVVVVDNVNYYVKTWLSLSDNPEGRHTVTCEVWGYELTRKHLLHGIAELTLCYPHKYNTEKLHEEFYTDPQVKKHMQEQKDLREQLKKLSKADRALVINEVHLRGMRKSDGKRI